MSLTYFRGLLPLRVNPWLAALGVAGCGVRTIAPTPDPARLTASYVRCNLRFVGTYGSAAIAALGDPNRRAIFRSPARKPKTVGETASELA